MKTMAALSGHLAGWLLLASGPAALGASADLPPGFGAEAMRHVEALAGLGSRAAGTPNEDRAARYVADQFRQMGLRVDVEPLTFESFEVTHLRATVAGQELQPLRIGMDPYGGELSYDGPCLLLDPRQPSRWPDRQLVAGRTVVTATTDEASLHFRLARLGPRFILYLSPSEFLELRGRSECQLSLSIEGRLAKNQSSNVVAHLGAPPPAPQISLGAHLDAYRGCPGANDNATGVGALLELARYFRDRMPQAGLGLSFVAFGAEELGVLGSRQYVTQHAEELESLVLVLALDNLGGSGPVAVERNGGETVVSERKNLDTIPGPYRRRAWEGLTFPWVLLPPAGAGLIEALSTSYHPPWLVESIDAAAVGLSAEVTFTGVQFTDQISFGSAGIATSAVSAVNGVAHTGGDGPESVRWDSLESCAELAAGIVSNVMDHLTRQAERLELPAGER